MKLLILFLLIPFLILCQSNHQIYKHHNIPVLVKNTPVDTLAELIEFTRRFYRWVETKNTNQDFLPQKGNNQDTAYIGIDWEIHNKRIKELKETKFFSKGFLENYQLIAETIDNNLKNGSDKWLIGDMPNFGNGANPWCNCQDSPSDKYFDSLIVTIEKPETNLVLYQWDWSNTLQNDYQIAASKDSSWRIEYLHGFNKDMFFNK